MHERRQDTQTHPPTHPHKHTNTTTHTHTHPSTSIITPEKGLLDMAVHLSSHTDTAQEATSRPLTKCSSMLISTRSLHRSNSEHSSCTSDRRQDTTARRTWQRRKRSDWSSREVGQVEGHAMQVSKRGIRSVEHSRATVQDTVHGLPSQADILKKQSWDGRNDDACALLLSSRGQAGQ